PNCRNNYLRPRRHLLLGMVTIPKKPIRLRSLLIVQLSLTPNSEVRAMMTMSRAISAGQAVDYYQQEFTNSKDNYYSEAGGIKGRWSGRLADEWKLKGEVTSEQYERLVAGQDPLTGEQLVQAVTARDTVNAYG